MIVNLSICLTDIPKEKIRWTDGKKAYINLILSERKEVSKYGDTHTIMLSKTKEEREANTTTIYVGSGKLYEPKPATPVTPQQIDEFPPIGTYDLPF